MTYNSYFTLLKRIYIHRLNNAEQLKEAAN